MTDITDDSSSSVANHSLTHYRRSRSDRPTNSAIRHGPAPRETCHSVPVCFRYPLVVGCISKTRDGVTLYFGAHARVLTMHIVESGHLWGPAERVPTTEAVAV